MLHILFFANAEIAKAVALAKIIIGGSKQSHKTSRKFNVF